MPGLINMENGGQNGARTDQDFSHNGVNGAGAEGSMNAASGANAVVKPSVGGEAAGAANGGHSAAPEQGGPQPPEPQGDSDAPRRMNDLPDEIMHVTQGFIPLSMLLSRLAQTTHNALQDKIGELAKMPVPAAAVNGSTALPATAPDDTSNDNLRKKATLLNFAQDMRAKWVKALVISEWSRKSEMVSKLIDLKFHIDQQRVLYESALENSAAVKRDLSYARMPSPDLKTALQVLSTGKAAWMPDLHHIAPPPLTPQEQLKWINDLDTLLSLRLNLDDFDKIPYQFRNYEIDSGRVTFKVPGEFDVDLTIADEDFEKQFWFIDFRFTFSPSAPVLPEALRSYLEMYVNDVLSRDGLSGCYQFLHEFVLTHKLNELKRQAIQLSKRSWTGTLNVEPLNRALAIQYWTSRTPPTGPKSWVLVAVDSGKKPNGPADPKSSSHLVAKWYRDNKEVKDVKIELDVDNLSAEALLKSVIGLHIEYMLTSIHNTLRKTARFRSREVNMVLHVSRSDPAASSLRMQVGYNSSTSLAMEPTTRLFAVKPHSKFTIQHEHHLNNGRNPTEDGVTCLENVRCGFVEDELNRRGGSMGWATQKCPLTNEELRSTVKTRDWTRTIWLQRDGWEPGWFVMVLLSLGGDEWWLLEVNRNASTTTPAANHHPVKFQAKLPLNKGCPKFTDGFWANLTLFSTGIISQSVDMRELHRNHIKSTPNESRNWALPQQVRLPSIDIALSGIFPSMVFGSGELKAAKSNDAAGDGGELTSIVRPMTGIAVSAQQPWANDVVSIQFKGVQSSKKAQPAAAGGDGMASEQQQPRLLNCVSDAIIKVRRPAKFASLSGMVDRDVTYDPRKGEFHLRMRHVVGQPMLSILRSRVKAVDRFVNFMESMDKAKGTIQSESVTLRQVTFSYGGHVQETVDEETTGQGSSKPSRWRVVLDLSREDIDIQLERGNPHLRVVDLMQSLANSDGGIEAMMVWLPTSLPAMGVVDKIESSWADIQAQMQGQVEFSMKTVDWMSIRYTIGSAAPAARSVTLEARIKIRRGEPWWHIWRSSPGDARDEFGTALKPIFDRTTAEWQGLVTSAAARPDKGFVGLLTAVDDAIRALVGTSPAPAGGGGSAGDAVVLD